MRVQFPPEPPLPTISPVTSFAANCQQTRERKKFLLIREVSFTKKEYALRSGLLRLFGLLPFLLGRLLGCRFLRSSHSCLRMLGSVAAAACLKRLPLVGAILALARSCGLGNASASLAYV
ncbi:hypothetical protein D6833_10775, partial [Candidatus Parcubacteria bacterium]